jgi:hypothetical protein
VWHESNTWQWVPPAAGTYLFQVWARQAGSIAAFDAWRSSSPYTATRPSALTVTALSPDEMDGAGKWWDRSLHAQVVRIRRQRVDHRTGMGGRKHVDVDPSGGRHLLHSGLGAQCGFDESLRRMDLASSLGIGSGIVVHSHHDAIADAAAGGRRPRSRHSERFRRTGTLHVSVLRVRRQHVEHRSELERGEHVQLGASDPRHVLYPGLGTQRRVGGRLRSVGNARSLRRHPVVTGRDSGTNSDNGGKPLLLARGR